MGPGPHTDRSLAPLTLTAKASSSRRSRRLSPKAASTSPCTPSRISPPNSIPASSSPPFLPASTRATPGSASSTGRCTPCPSDGRIGTTSPRRQAQLLALRPDLNFVEIRGNVDTRLRKLAEGACDALVLASAGLDRLDRAEWVHQRFAIDELCPAPGQGALALETRAPSYAVFSEPDHDNYVRAAVAALDHPETRFSIEVERTVLDALGGGCSIPIGVHCAPVTEDNNPIAWHIHAQVIAPDGEAMICVSTDAPAGISARTFGQQIAADLKSRGALELLAPVHSD